LLPVVANILNANICADDDIVPVGVPLPLTSGITTPNVVPSPFLNVRVLPVNDAVVKPKLADVNKLAVAVFNEDVLTPTDVNLVSIDAV